ncbi:DUF1569 domain-containing protein [Yeosuana marina]|uniref:DUF1569 domain-containing protein n=1 Tax=Yeosuana marina TaxID=1565536 RepID=UPI0030EC2794|tara:strand:- start:232 stop:705 length:474 start_codon:yes stop_codon:yes gene_type:complete
MNNRRLTILKNQLSKLEAYIPLIDKENPKVSKSKVGWQLDHTLKVFNAVSEWIENSNSKDYERTFNFWRSILFPLGYFPRGKVNAPKFVMPPEIIVPQDLRTQIQLARTHTEHLKELPKQAYYKHFVFGKLSKNQTLRFLEIHTKHHLKIINDILKK